MSVYDAYTKNTMLEEIGFIGGTDFVLDIEIYNEYGDRMNLTSSRAKWLLAPYGQPDINVGELECTVETVQSNHVFRVIIPSALTVNLQGLYTQQLLIYDSEGKLLRPFRGTIVISKAIPEITGGL